MNKMSFFSVVVLILGVYLGMGELKGEASKSAVDPEALKHWQSLRFGMFIHWGPVSLMGHEISWSRGGEIPFEYYDKLYQSFDPINYDPNQWVKIAKEAGMKYLVFTTKHHDGFCLWDSKYTDYNIMHSPYGKDIVRMLAIACHKGGIDFGVYHSVIDMHHPDYPVTGPSSPPSPDQYPHRAVYNVDQYMRYLRNQVGELIQNYGPLLTVWFDVPWEVNPQGIPLIEYVRHMQPNILINDRAGTDKNPVGDYATPEQTVGAFNRQRPWESCITIGDQWAWEPASEIKPLEECLHILVHTVGGDGNLLLNVGPMADGRIETRQVSRLREIGQWLEKYGEGIYGTRGGPVKPGHWGACTCRGNTIYLFVENWLEDGSLRLPDIQMPVTAMALMSGPPEALTWDQASGSLRIHIKQIPKAKSICVIKVTVEGEAEKINPVDMP